MMNLLRFPSYARAPLYPIWHNQDKGPKKITTSILHECSVVELEDYRKNIRKTSPRNLFKVDWWQKLRLLPTMFQYWKSARCHDYVFKV